jgi:hypothetical protein
MRRAGDGTVTSVEWFVAGNDAGSVVSRAGEPATTPSPADPLQEQGRVLAARMKYIGELGDEGWELVGTNGDTHWYKRPKD